MFETSNSGNSNIISTNSTVQYKIEIRKYVIEIFMQYFSLKKRLEKNLSSHEQVGMG